MNQKKLNSRKLFEFKTGAFTVLLFSVVSILMLISSCNDLPTPMGYNLVDDTVKLLTLSSRDKSIFTGYTAITSRIKAFARGGFVGNSDDLQAITLIRFTESVIPRNFDLFSENDIIRTDLLFPPTGYAYGNTASNNLSFKIYKVKKRWERTIDFDSIVSPWGSFTDLIDNRELASYSGNIPLVDSLPYVEIPFNDNSLIIEWINSMSRYSVDSVTTWGIALVPDFATCNVIRGMYTQTLNAEYKQPIIRVVYKNKKNQIAQLLIQSAMEIPVFKDKPLDKDYIQFRGGTATITKLDFDFSSLKKFSGIHKAELILTLCPEKCSYGYNSLDSFAMIYIPMSSDPEKILPIDSTLTWSSYGYRDIDSSSGKHVLLDTYTFPAFATAIDVWVRRKGLGSVYLSSIDYVYLQKRLNKLVFYGSDAADTTKRPKVRLIYSERPEYDKYKNQIK